MSSNPEFPSLFALFRVERIYTTKLLRTPISNCIVHFPKEISTNLNNRKGNSLQITLKKRPNKNDLLSIYYETKSESKTFSLESTITKITAMHYRTNIILNFSYLFKFSFSNTWCIWHLFSSTNMFLLYFVHNNFIQLITLKYSDTIRL